MDRQIARDLLSIGAVFLLMLMIRDGEMARVSSLFYLVPPTTAIIAWFLFGETLTTLQLVPAMRLLT